MSQNNKDKTRVKKEGGGGTKDDKKTKQKKGEKTIKR
jgi:hypothetical protein